MGDGLVVHIGHLLIGEAAGDRAGEFRRAQCGSGSRWKSSNRNRMRCATEADDYQSGDAKDRYGVVAPVDVAIGRRRSESWLMTTLVRPSSCMETWAATMIGLPLH